MIINYASSEAAAQDDVFRLIFSSESYGKYHRLKKKKNFYLNKQTLLSSFGEGETFIYLLFYLQRLEKLKRFEDRLYSLLS